MREKITQANLHILKQQISGEGDNCLLIEIKTKQTYIFLLLKHHFLAKRKLFIQYRHFRPSLKWGIFIPKYALLRFAKPDVYG